QPPWLCFSILINAARRSTGAGDMAISRIPPKELPREVRAVPRGPERRVCWTRRVAHEMRPHRHSRISPWRTPSEQETLPFSPVGYGSRHKPSRLWPNPARFSRTAVAQLEVLRGHARSPSLPRTAAHLTLLRSLRPRRIAAA